MVAHNGNGKTLTRTAEALIAPTNGRTNAGAKMRKATSSLVLVLFISIFMITCGQLESEFTYGERVFGTCLRFRIRVSPSEWILNPSQSELKEPDCLPL